VVLNLFLSFRSGDCLVCGRILVRVPTDVLPILQQFLRFLSRSNLRGELTKLDLNTSPGDLGIGP
jgi:hypothetical protein